jgi:hypothetical protein
MYEQLKGVYSSMLVLDMKMIDDPLFHVAGLKMRQLNSAKNCGSMRLDITAVIQS